MSQKFQNERKLHDCQAGIAKLEAKITPLEHELGVKARLRTRWRIRWNLMDKIDWDSLPAINPDQTKDLTQCLVLVIAGAYMGIFSYTYVPHFVSLIRYAEVSSIFQGFRGPHSTGVASFFPRLTRHYRVKHDLGEPSGVQGDWWGTESEILAFSVHIPYRRRVQVVQVEISVSSQHTTPAKKY